MDEREREFVLGELVSSEALILQVVEGLTAAQWAFREADGRWSIAEILEHLVVFEGFILGRIAEVLSEPADLEKKALAAGKEPLVLGLAGSRETKFMAREVVRPVGRWTDPVVLVGEFRTARARTVAFAEETRAALREHFFAHIAFGDLDCYQWLVLLGRHSTRHALQIEEILGCPNFPGVVL
jgi:hypothetical protein